uniref:Uncharacterized protein n=1 Tax=Arundo donax TaxID=35708 RepID=A0A0A9AXY0_ARUDO
MVFPWTMAFSLSFSQEWSLRCTSFVWDKSVLISLTGDGYNL